MNKNFTLLAAAFAITTSLSSCGGKGQNDSNGLESESMSYQFNYNGCDTERHDFDSRAAMCAGLQNDSLNHYCAANLRAEHYQQYCK